MRWNGANRRTTFVSGTQLHASVAAADIAAAGTAQVSVVTLAPGGGESAPLAFTVSPPPAPAVSATSVAAGQQVTVTLTGGLGGSNDWLAFSATSAADSTYVTWIYVAGVTTRTWTVTTPSTLGTYEFRLFTAGYTRLATSPTTTVTLPPPAIPVLSGLSPVSVLAGSVGFALTATGSSFATSSAVRWTGADRRRRSSAARNFGPQSPLPTSRPQALHPSPSSRHRPVGGTSSVRTFTIAEPPTLSVNTTIPITCGPVTVTLANGLGGSQEWLALSAPSAPNMSYVHYVYVGAGSRRHLVRASASVNL